jgi:hypothetical protein
VQVREKEACGEANLDLAIAITTEVAEGDRRVWIVTLIL